MAGIEILQKNQPYYLPGYTGYCPQNRFVCGETYANASHKLLLDPTIHHAEKLTLVDNTNNYEIEKPSEYDIKTVKSRIYKGTPIYKHPMVSTYDGFIPNVDDLKDKPFPVQATQAIAAFERQQLKQKLSRGCLKKILKLQQGIEPIQHSNECLLLQSKFKLPLIEVRPERIGVERIYFDSENSKNPKDKMSPYFMENTNPQKYFVNGYTGYVPNSHAHFGKPFKKMSADGLRDFTTSYLYKKKIEWAPITIPCKTKAILSVSSKTSQIHLKDTALMPNYTGHVPGAKYEIGKTYGYSSRGANQYIKDQLFSSKLSRCYNHNAVIKS